MAPRKRNEFQLKNVVVSTIKPEKKLPHPEKSDVALFDMYLVDFMLPMLLLYRPDQSRLSASDFVARLKKSLSTVLVPYYPFAGRSCKTYDARVRELRFNDEGLPFIEAEIDEKMETVVNIDDFQPNSILSGYEFLNLDPVAFDQMDVEQPLPACFIQVTKFSCGGIAVTVTFSHQYADGQAMFQFLKDWSQTALQGYSSCAPIHDRSLTYPFSKLFDLMAPSSSNDQEKHSENGIKGRESATPSIDDKPSPTGEHEHAQYGTKGLQNAYVAGSPPAETESKEKNEKVDMGPALRLPLNHECSRKVLHVKRESVEKLKKKAVDSNMDIIPTTLDCINSHIWRGMSNIPSSVDNRTPTLCGIIVEGRKRLHDPSIPTSYSGNDFLLVFTDPIKGPSHDPLIEAKEIHNLVRSISPQSWIPQLVRSLQFVRNAGDSKERTFFITSWYRFPMYEADFGWGKPVLATYNNINACPTGGYFVVLPPRPDSDYIATIMVILPPEPLQALLADPDFRSFFH